MSQLLPFSDLRLEKLFIYLKFLSKKLPTINEPLPYNVLEDVDMILIMTVNPGFGGQSFIEGMIEKIKELKSIIDEKNLNVDIQVDGGIKPSNIDKVVKAGANVIVAGSAIFNSDDINETVKLMRKNAAL